MEGRQKWGRGERKGVRMEQRGRSVEKRRGEERVAGGGIAMGMGALELAGGGAMRGLGGFFLAGASDQSLKSKSASQLLRVFCQARRDGRHAATEEAR